jgi:hypothetical protein
MGASMSGAQRAPTVVSSVFVPRTTAAPLLPVATAAAWLGAGCGSPGTPVDVPEAVDEAPRDVASVTSHMLDYPFAHHDASDRISWWRRIEFSVMERANAGSLRLHLWFPEPVRVGTFDATEVEVDWYDDGAPTPADSVRSCRTDSGTGRVEGSVVVTRADDRFAGTFELSVACPEGGTRAVTDGRFDLPNTAEYLAGAFRPFTR